MMRQIITPSLRTHLLLLILLAMAPLFALTLFSAAEQRATNAQRVQDNALLLARVSVNSHEQLIEGARQTLIVLSQLPVVRNGDAPACNVLFADLLRQYPYYSNLAVLRLNGDVSCSAVPFTEPVNAADRPWFQRVIRTRTFTISEYQVGRITHKAVLTTAYPVTDAAGGLQGIVTISIDTAWLNQLVANPRLPAGSAFVVFDRAGTVLAHYPDPEAWVGQLLDQTPLFRVIQSQHGAGTVIAPGLDGQMRLFGVASLRTTEDAEAVYLAVGIPTAQAFAPVTRALLRNLLVLGLVAIFSQGAVWLLADRLLVRRLGRLTQAAVRLGAGDLAARFGPSYGSSELGLLARTFDNMAAALEEHDARRRSAETALMMDVAERKQAEEAQRETKQYLENVINRIADPIFVKDREHRFVLVNDAQCALVGRKREELLGRTDYDFFPKEQVDLFWAQDESVFEAGQENASEEQATDAQGRLRTFVTKKSQYTDRAGNEFVVGIAHDITERKQAEEALRQARDQLQAVLDAMPGAVSWISSDLRYLGCNRYLAEVLNLAPEAVAGRAVGFLGTSPGLSEFARDFFTGPDREAAREIDSREADGSIRRYLVVARKYHHDQAAVFAGIDITERKQAEAALRESRAMLQQILDTVPQAIFWKGKASVYLGCNQAFARAAGLTDPAQVVGKTDFDLPWPRQNAEVYRADDAQIVVSGIPKRHSVELQQQADGTRLWINISKLPLLDAQGEAQGVLGVYEDITERRQAEEALREYAGQLRVLTARLANAEEGERRRLAQELHDRVGQNLTALSINLNIVANLLPPGSVAKIGPRLEDSLELVSETVEHIRDVMAELRPPVLDDYGLLAALRWYGQRFAQRTGLAITTQGADPTPRLPLATEITLFRIAQEALTNAARHAQARQVAVTLEAAAGGARLTIADDGTGFDPELRTQPNGRQAWGLLTMVERAESIGGRLVMDAAPGHGTRVIVEVGSGL